MSGYDRIEKQGQQWFLDQTTVNPGKSQLTQFPSDTFPDKEEQAAISAYQQCSHALAHLHDFLKIILKGLYSEVQEVTVRVKNYKFRLRRRMDDLAIDWIDYQHAILRVTTLSGEHYALDLTGAQYGWTEPVLPWDTFLASRVGRIDKIEYFGRYKTYVKAKNLSLGKERTYIHSINEDFEDKLMKFLRSWAENDIPLAALLLLPEKEFQERQEGLVKDTDWVMQLYQQDCIAHELFNSMS